MLKTKWARKGEPLQGLTLPCDSPKGSITARDDPTHRDMIFIVIVITGLVTLLFSNLFYINFCLIVIILFIRNESKFWYFQTTTCITWLALHKKQWDTLLEHPILLVPGREQKKRVISWRKVCHPLFLWSTSVVLPAPSLRNCCLPTTPCFHSLTHMSLPHSRTQGSPT